MPKKFRACSLVIVFVLLFNFLIFSTIKTCTLFRQLATDQQHLQNYTSQTQFCLSFCEGYSREINGLCCQGLDLNCIGKKECGSESIKSLKHLIDQQYKQLCIFATAAVLIILTIALTLNYLRLKRKQQRRQLLQRLLESTSRESRLTLNKTITRESFVVTAEGAECVICLDGYGEKRAVDLNCGHWFHRECIENWMGSRNNCPICRSAQ